MDATLVCLTACLMFPPIPADGWNAERAARPRTDIVHSTTKPPSDAPRGLFNYRLAESYDEVIIRAQSYDSPYYDYGTTTPPAGGGSVPQYPYNTPTDPGYGTPTPPTQPITPGSAPTYTPPATPYDPATPGNPFAVPQQQPMAVPYQQQPMAPFQTYGVNGPQPYDVGPGIRLDATYITPANSGGGYGEVDVFELDLEMPNVSPTGDGNMFTFTPQFNTRLFDGPSSPPGRPGFPSDLYRFGWDFQYDFLATNSNWSGELGFNPSINTDFEKSLTMDSVNWDGRAIAYFRSAPNVTWALGALYYDRVDDKILPYVGVIYLPNDRWELRLVFPEPQISYFAGHVWGKPTWIYARAEYNIEAYEVEVPAGRGNQLQIEDWRIMFGARKEQGWGNTFLEGGWVINREVEYDSAAPGFDMDSAFLVRGGIRY